MSEKGKAKAIDLTDSDDSDSDSDSVSSDSSSSSEDSFVTREELDELFQQCRRNAEEAEARLADQKLPQEEDVLQLDDDPYLNDTPLPPLDPGKLPETYFDLDDEQPKAGSSRLRDPSAQIAAKAASALDVPAPPTAPPELTKSGKPLTKKERKALKSQTAGPDWFDLPAPAEADLPRLYREVEAMRLRNQLDPKRFYRKDEGEGKGIKGLPKYFAIGTMVATETPFGGASSDNLPKAHRKRTMVDELMDDAEAKRYAKRKFNDLQGVRGARGRNTLQAKKALRQQKW